MCSAPRWPLHSGTCLADAVEGVVDEFVRLEAELCMGCAAGRSPNKGGNGSICDHNAPSGPPSDVVWPTLLLVEFMAAGVGVWRPGSPNCIRDIGESNWTVGAVGAVGADALDVLIGVIGGAIIWRACNTLWFHAETEYVCVRALARCAQA
jgi:hypothetical protein